MADELKTVSRHVTGATTAVVAMQAAVIKADQEAADQVCNDVNRGFHALMSSQISQKIAKLQSDVDSHLLRLNQQTKQLLAIKRQMERDYRRTAERYGKTFNTINRELRQRVQELDQPIFRFATTEIEVTRNRMTALAATVPVAQCEGVTEAQRILTSNVKYHGMQVLESTGAFVSGMEEQRALTKRILLSDQKAESKSLYAPVIVSEGTFEQGSTCSAYVSRELLSDQGAANVRSEIIQQASGMAWHDHSDEHDEVIRNEFARLMTESAASDRVKKTINGLIQAANSYQTI
jgi:hypothetical protein